MMKTSQVIMNLSYKKKVSALVQFCEHVLMYLKGTVMQTEKALINDHLRVSKVF